MKKIKNIIAFILILCMGFVFVGCNKEQVKLPDNSDAPSKDDLMRQMNEDTSAAASLDFEIIDYGDVEINEDFDFNKISNYVQIDIAEYGSIIILLRPDVAPITVNNFKKLVLQDFYNGLTLHRVVKDFIIEGGEQSADGVIHDSEMIFGEFADNNFTNNLSHKRGVISMSRKNLPDSASSGFFIVCKDAPQLDSRYAAFGYVISGMEVIDKLNNAEVGANDKPQSDIVIENTTFLTIKNN